MRSSSERPPRRCPQCRDPFIGEPDTDGYLDCNMCGRVPATRAAFIADARAALDAAPRYPDIQAS